MSVSHTTQQVRDRSKTVTRRLGWWKDKNGRSLLDPGDTLTLCEKVMGRKKGEPLVRICDVRVVRVTRERLSFINLSDVQREGFGGWLPAEFVAFFCETFKVTPETMVTRIEWEYLP